jgi:hypothetical protein
MRANHQSLEQVDPDSFFDGLDDSEAVGARRLTALPKVLAAVCGSISL